MPQGVRPPVPGRPQTLREARRAYQKAGRTPSFTAAQIRAAERAAEADRRATEIQAKERRAKETKRRREEQDARKREEQRTLVQLGRLPEDSLWGKVRASQQRLHNFFGARQHPEEGDKPDATDLHQETAASGVRASSVVTFDKDVPDPGLGSFPAPAFQYSQKVSSLPAENTSVAARTREKVNPIDVNRPVQEETVRVVRSTQAPLDAQLSFSGTQLFSNFVDDGDLEGELNGPSSSIKLLENRSARQVNHNGTSQVHSPSRKRKADELCLFSPPGEKAARLVFGKVSPSMLNTHTQDKADTLPKSSSTRLCLNASGTGVDLVDTPTASQVEAMFRSQDSEDDELHSDKENLNPCYAALNKENSADKIQVLVSTAAEAHTSAPCPVKPLNEKRPPAKRSSVLQDEHGSFDNTNFLKHYSGDEFGDDSGDEILELACEAFEVAQATSEMILKSWSPKTSVILRSSPRKLQIKQATSSPSEAGDVPCRTQDSFYDLDGVDDDDLAGLVDISTSGQNSDNPISPETSSSSKARFGRTIP